MLFGFVVSQCVVFQQVLSVAVEIKSSVFVIYNPR